MSRKILSVLLSLCLVLPVISTGVSAASFDDVGGHWAEGAITRWASYGVVRGDGAGAFHPNDGMTRAAAAQVFVNLLGLQKSASLAAYSDVIADAWYADALSKCVAAGILRGSGNTMDPDGKVTREMFFVMFARALGIEEEQTEKMSFTDAASVSSWAKGYINALANKGYVRGTGGGVDPLTDINRASVMSLLDQTIGTYANTDGASVEGAGDKITLIACKDATVKGAVADLVVSAGAQGGKVTLDNVILTGTLTLDTAAEVELTGNSVVSDIVVTTAAAGARVTVAQGSAMDRLTCLADNCTVEADGQIKTVLKAKNLNDFELVADGELTVKEIEESNSSDNVVSDNTENKSDTDSSGTGKNGDSGSGTNSDSVGTNTGNGTNSDSVGTNTGNGQNDAAAYQAELAALAAKAEATAQSFADQLSQLASAAQSTYGDMKLEGKSRSEIVAALNGYVSAAGELEGACDAAVVSIIGQIRQLIAENGGDQSYADDLMSSYQAAKNSMRTEYQGMLFQVGG